ncbi:3'-5' exonuclease [Culex quinquefasciatus]|uniref:Exonuclease 3'-5' domain-containing protein 2 n=1 Tax=Culex quinquefasciatus TaxID=7176 RepID=B0WTA6_CULQU|nr:3'-5' exonuclease [Culex quinquefasciatus]|eukprot:XP_001853674.1 3'-5' exonuclease [Culex quinquefasciatus]
MGFTDRERTIAATVAVVGVGTAAVLVALCNKRKIIQRFRGPLYDQTIRVVTNAEECQQVVGTLRNHCRDYRILGFDCEWVTEKGKRHPVALLQLASHQGLCALIRLCQMKRIPPELGELLNDPGILKVGIGAIEDAQLLRSDYNLKVESALDLRHLAERCRVPGPYGMARLAEKSLGLQLDKHWRVRASDWEALELSERQLKYAANDAHVAVELFRLYADRVLRCGIFTTRKKWFDSLMTEIECFLDQRYKDPPKSQKGAASGGKNGKKKLLDSKNSVLELKRSMSTRAKPLYDNCIMTAPDGEVLCTCDRKKAEWYVIKELADIVSDQPTYTIRLRFEPKGRAVGEVGKYYQTPKENKCVVCGEKDSYIRKNVVPRDYRRHFPLVMKEHISHDVLLLCAPCHRRSTMNDENMRLKLASLCTAPFTANDNPKEIRVESMAELRKAARALVYCADRIPPERLASLRRKMQRLLGGGQGVQLTREALEHYANIQTAIPNGDYFAHGEKVVEYFKEQPGGIGELERMWREHFLHSMKPKFMPDLWSVEHNVKRLEIRADEGRVNEEDLAMAGVSRPIRKPTQSATNSSSSNSNGSTTQTSESTHSSAVTSSSSSSSAVLPLLSDNDSTARDVSSYRDEEATLEPQSKTDKTTFYSNREDSRTLYASAAATNKPSASETDQFRTVRPEDDPEELATANDFESLESSYDSDDSDSTLSQPSMTLLNSTDDWEAEVAANEPAGVNGTVALEGSSTSSRRWN